MPLVSIIVPVYRIPEPYLRKCIESLTNQTLEDIEIVLVDDGSPDKCGDICDEYAYTDNRIRVLHQQNGGLSYARNVGVLASTGQYITFVDADDWIEKDTCEIAYSTIVKYSVDVVVWAISQDFGDSNSKIHRFFDNDILLDDKIKIREYSLYRMDRSRRAEPIDSLSSPYAKLYSRVNIVENNLLFNEDLRYGEEIEHSLRFFEKAESAYYIAKPLYHFRFNNQSLTRRFDPVLRDGYKQSLIIMYDFITNAEDRASMIKSFRVLACVCLLSCGVNISFHFNNDKKLSEKLNDFKKLAEEQPFYDAVWNAEIKVLPVSHIIPLLFIKYKLYFLFYLVCKVRQIQVWLKQRFSK